MDSSQQHRSGYQQTRDPIVDAQGHPVLDQTGVPTYQAQPAIGRAEQATIDVTFMRAKKYWKSYMNIRRAVFNTLMMASTTPSRYRTIPLSRGEMR
jgi:hypothetical protein